MKKYFASLPSDELIPEINKRIERFYKNAESTGEVKTWKKAFSYYFGQHVVDSDNTQVSKHGDDGELSAFGVNYYRNLIKHTLALTCSSKPAFDCKAVNSDPKSMQQARVGNNILDFYISEKRLFRYIKQTFEKAIVLKRAFLYQTWDPSQGRPYSVNQEVDEDGQLHEKIIHEGDIQLEALSPWFVVYDKSLTDWNKAKWCVVITLENKFDLASRYPKNKEKILNLDNTFIGNFDYSSFIKEYQNEDELSELIPVYNFYHIESDSLMKGRYLRYVSDGTELYDDGYPYRKKLPICRVAPSEEFDSIDGYSDFADIMVLQQVLNIIYSTIFTNQQALGVQAVWMPDGCNVSEDTIGLPLVILKGGAPGTEPKAINLTATPAELFKNADYIERAMEKIAGTNATMRGDPESNLKSGAALGRMQAMAIQYASNLQQSWAELQEDSGTGILHMLQDFAITERMISVAGKFNKSAMKSFIGDDIKNVDRVTVDLGNPIARLFTGRMDLADKFLEKGLIRDIQQYFQITNSGSIDPILEGPQAETDLVRQENEDLQEGRAVMAMVGDPHLMHSREHRKIIADPDLRRRANTGDQEAIKIVENVLAHIKEHDQLRQTQDMFWVDVSGEAPPPPPPQQMMPPGAPMPPMNEPMPQQPPDAPPIPPLPPMGPM